MAELSVVGRVVRAADMAPLAGVPIRLIGPAAALSGLPQSQPLPPGRQVSWTRQISGFAGTRWDCWSQLLQGRLSSITWQQFCDGALTYNPSLNPSHLFQADQSYLLPEEVPAPPYSWTRQIGGFAGTRWDCWVLYISGQVRGITWEQFRDGALLYNPQLNGDGRLFKSEQSYIIPQNDMTPRAMLIGSSDAQGNYRFALGGLPGVYELQVELEDYGRVVLPLAVSRPLTQPIVLTPLLPLPGPPPPGLPPPGPPPGAVRSALPGYATLPDVARRVIDHALFMLGDDRAVFDALPPDLQQMCYGWLFRNDPNNMHYKDLVCADLVSIALKAAGLNIGWGGRANPHMADYYVPDGNPQLFEIRDPNDWLPGDVLVYGPSFSPGRRAGHVNLYVGPFSGTDRSGTTYRPSDSAEVVEASMDFVQNGKELGTGVSGRTLQLYCLQKKCYSYQWVRHVRLRELAAAFRR